MKTLNDTLIAQQAAATAGEAQERNPPIAEPPPRRNPLVNYALYRNPTPH